MIESLAVRIGPEAVVVVAAQPLRALSSAVLGGPASELGWSIARAASRALWAGIRGRRKRNG